MTMTTDTNGLAAALAKSVEQHRAERAPAPVVEAEPEATTDLVPVAPMAPAPAAPDFRMTPPKVVGGLPYASTYARLSKTICGTEMVPGSLRGRWDAVMAAMMMGYELGLGPMQALNGIQVIDGKAGLSAEMMRALITGQGHVFILSATNEKASVRCRRTEWPEGEMSTFEWTLEDARRANLIKANTNRSGWAKYPRAMLSARATSEAARAIFPDVLAGMSYTPEEIGTFDEGPTPTYPPVVTAQAESVTVTEPAPEPPAVDVETGEIIEPESEPAPEPAKRAAKRQSAPSTTNAEVADRDVRNELRQGLQAVIKSLPNGQAQLVRTYLGKNDMGNLPELTAEQLTEACRIAAGWPTSVVSMTEAPEDDTDAVDAEVVGDGTETVDEATDEPEGMF
jgi:hypothetical protein